MTDWKKEWKKLALIAGAFLACFFLPIGKMRFDRAVLEALHLVKWYAQEHVLLCLVPAFFIAGAIAVFVSQGSVMKYLGAKANKAVAYTVASVSGTILAVCSCTVLPLFAGIYRMGAGLGPATAFLYSGPAINVLAIALTARVLGLKIGIARASGSIMHNIAEGFDAETNAEFTRFLGYAKRSCTEVQSQLYVAKDQDYISPGSFQALYDMAGEARAAIRGFMKYLRNNERPPAHD